MVFQLAFASFCGVSLDKFSDIRIWTTVTILFASLNLQVTVTSPNWNVKICEPYRVFKYTERGSFFNTSTILAWKWHKEKILYQSKQKTNKWTRNGWERFRSHLFGMILTRLIRYLSICWVARSLKATSKVVSAKIQFGTLTVPEVIDGTVTATVPGDEPNCWTCGWAARENVSSPSGSSRASNAWLSSSVDTDWFSVNAMFVAMFFFFGLL